MRIARNGFILSQVICSASAILVAPSSPCEKNCGNVLQTTTGSDMQCNEDRFTSTPAGIVFQTCTNCELTSPYASQGQTDLQWLLYNTRYAVSWCLFGFPDNKDVGSSPCMTSTACGPLQEAMQWQNLTKNGGPYDYCQKWDETQVSKCTSCLSSGNHFLANYMTILDAACMQKPEVGSTISVEGTPFSTVPMNITTPTPTAFSQFNQDTGPLTLGAKVGIAAGGVILILALAGCGIVCNGKRRRRAFLRRLEQRHGAQGWPHPQQNTDMFETPVSQKPLRGGWEDSPISAQTESTEKPFPRYFSPYSSQYNSPVSAVEATNMQWPANAWPSTQEEKLAQIAHEQQVQQQSAQSHNEIQIGLALGGDDPSIRSKPSNQSIQSQGYGPSDSKGKDRGEEYELYEVPPPPPHAPVLQHPGYGRQYSSQHAHYGGLTEEDAQRGNAL